MRFAFKAFGSKDPEQLAKENGSPGVGIEWATGDGGDPFRWELHGLVTADNTQLGSEAVHDELVEMGLSVTMVGIDVWAPCRVCGFDQEMHTPPQSMGHEFIDQLNPWSVLGQTE